MIDWTMELTFFLNEYDEPLYENQKNMQAQENQSRAIKTLEFGLRFRHYG